MLHSRLALGLSISSNMKSLFLCVVPVFSLLSLLTSSDSSGAGSTLAIQPSAYSANTSFCGWRYLFRYCSTPLCTFGRRVGYLSTKISGTSSTCMPPNIRLDQNTHRGAPRGECFCKSYILHWPLSRKSSLTIHLHLVTPLDMLS
jgi:hypothetical protein